MLMKFAAATVGSGAAFRLTVSGLAKARNKLGSPRRLPYETGPSPAICRRLPGIGPV